MNIRKAKPGDMQSLLALFDEARKTIALLGINQWQNGYPNIEVVEEDIAKGRSYIMESDGVTAGSFAIIDDGEVTYDRIYDGAWLTGDSDDYIALHRVAVAVSMRGTGVSSKIVGFAKDYAQNLGRKSIRIDTHEGNAVMRRMLEKHGFEYCGTIWVADGTPRMAYHKTK